MASSPESTPPYRPKTHSASFCTVYVTIDTGFSPINNTVTGKGSHCNQMPIGLTTVAAASIVIQVLIHDLGWMTRSGQHGKYFLEVAD